MINVVSGFSPRGYEEYGKEFLATFHKYWDRSVQLTVYTEAPVDMPRGSCRSLWDCNGARAFYDRHKDNPEKTGRKAHARWKINYLGRPYNFRFDAAKFFKQCMIPEGMAATLADDEIMCWLDGDVISHGNPPPTIVQELLGPDDIVFLGRQGTHSELGFWAVRLNAVTRKFLFTFAEIWRSDAVFDLPEWHSAFVFDHCRKLVRMRERNLTPLGRGHVWFETPLRHWMDHRKGERKFKGGSAEMTSIPRHERGGNNARNNLDRV